MNRLRRSFRESFRRKKDKVSESRGVHQWHSDEIGVRQGNCIFPIKYLGCVEVFESRGMPICEEALKVLRNTKRKSIRGTLFVTGDGLRVVDGETKGLIVDQTIEKVSFCAPDRNHERGFAYICRDGTTRRWMCHGFHAIGDTGERLSHAVGCAFAVCLERKQKRDKEAADIAAAAAAKAAQMSAAGRSTTNSHSFSSTTHNGASSSNGGGAKTNNNTTNIPPYNFARIGSFRQTSITDRLQDPQTCKPSEPPPMKPVNNPYAIDRPHATPLMLQRQTSFRPLSNLKSATPFKRQLSLRPIDAVAREVSASNLK